MISQQIDFSRILVVFVGGNFVTLLFLFLAYKIMKRNPIKTGYLFGLYYICIAIAGLLNQVYILIFVESVVVFLNYIVNLFVIISPSILLASQILLFYRYNYKRYILAVIIFVLIEIITITILTFNFSGVNINKNTYWRPLWSLLFYVIVLIFLFIPNFFNIIIAKKTLKSIPLGDTYHIKRWKYYMIGTIGAYTYLIFLITSNYLHLNVLSHEAGQFFELFIIPLIPFWTVFLYKGVIQHKEIIIND